MKIVVAFLILISLGHAQAQSFVTRADVDTLARWMTGSFSSTEQSASDTAYLDIRLHGVRIWPHRLDGRWLYIEQAVASAPDKPYRQRVYHLFLLNDSTIISQVYELKNPAGAVGAWRDNMPLAHLRSDSIESRRGCAVSIKKSFDGFYHGRIGERQCASSFRGAAYTTADVAVHRHMLVSWDRGWDTQGRQVWGATRGGYMFRRQ